MINRIKLKMLKVVVLYIELIEPIKAAYFSVADDFLVIK